MNDHPAFVSRQVLKSAYCYGLDAKPTASLQVVCGGWESCPPNYHIDRADFPYSSPDRVAAGKRTVTVDCGHFQLVPGIVFHYGPGIGYHISSEAESPLEMYFVGQDGPLHRRTVRLSDLQAVWSRYALRHANALEDGAGRRAKRVRGMSPSDFTCPEGQCPWV